MINDTEGIRTGSLNFITKCLQSIWISKGDGRFWSWCLQSMSIITQMFLIQMEISICSIIRQGVDSMIFQSTIVPSGKLVNAAQYHHHYFLTWWFFIEPAVFQMITPHWNVCSLDSKYDAAVAVRMYHESDTWDGSKHRIQHGPFHKAIFTFIRNWGLNFKNRYQKVLI